MRAREVASVHYKSTLRYGLCSVLGDSVRYHSIKRGVVVSSNVRYLEYMC